MPNENFPVPYVIKDPYSVPIYLDERLLLLRLNQEVLDDEDRLRDFHESFSGLIYPFNIFENQNFKSKPQVHEPLNFRWYFIVENDDVDLNELTEKLKNHTDSSGKVVEGISYAYYAEGHRDEPEHYKAPLPNTFVIKLNKGVTESERKKLLTFLEGYEVMFCKEKSALLGASSPCEMLYFYVPGVSLERIFAIKEDLENQDEFTEYIDSFYFEYIPFKYPFSFNPDDTYYNTINMGWNMRAIFAGSPSGASTSHFSGWNISRGSPEIAIAIIDTGVQRHIDLEGYNGEGFRFHAIDEACRIFSGGALCISEENDPGIVGDIIPCSLDDHGTKVAGIALGTLNNNKGIAGLAGRCNLFSLNIIVLSWVDFLCALNKAIEEGVKVVNMSFGAHYSVVDCSAGTINCQYAPNIIQINEAIKRAHDNGMVLCAAAGNDGNSLTIEYPACHPLVIAVGASLKGEGQEASPTPGEVGYPETQLLYDKSHGNPTDFCLQPSSTTTIITQISVVAPGVDISTTDTSDPPVAISSAYSHTFGQTSAATAHVSGLAALIFSVNPRLSPSKVREIIETTAIKIQSHIEIWQGYGQINVFKALLEAYRSKSFLGFLKSEEKIIEEIKAESLPA